MYSPDAAVHLKLTSKKIDGAIEIKWMTFLSNLLLHTLKFVLVKLEDHGHYQLSLYRNVLYEDSSRRLFRRYIFDKFKITTWLFTRKKSERQEALTKLPICFQPMIVCFIQCVCEKLDVFYSVMQHTCSQGSCSE